MTVVLLLLSANDCCCITAVFVFKKWSVLLLMIKIVIKTSCWNILAFTFFHGLSNCGMHSMSSMPLYISVSPIRSLTPTTVRILLCWRHMQHCKLQQVALEHCHKMIYMQHLSSSFIVIRLILITDILVVCRICMWPASGSR